MKLTNLQLEILTNAIASKINLKKEEFKNTDEYKQLVEESKVDINYERAEELVEEYNDLQEALTELQKQLTCISDEYRKLTGEKYASAKSIATIENTLNNLVNRKLADRFPIKDQIQADIILASIEGGDNIIQTILSKYGITEEN